jgi:hypothetical protein
MELRSFVAYCRIWSSHSNGYEQFHLLDCCLLHDDLLLGFLSESLKMVATCSSETLNDFQRPTCVISPKIQLFVGYYLLQNLLAYLDTLSLLQNLFIITELSACLLFTREMYSYFLQNFQLFNYLLVNHVQNLFTVYDIWGFYDMKRYMLWPLVLWHRLFW